MLTVEGIFDGQKIELLETIPFTSKKRVLITFLNEPLEAESTVEIDPIKALRGCAKGLHLTEKLLESRRDDLKRESTSWKR